MPPRKKQAPLSLAADASWQQMLGSITLGAQGRLQKRLARMQKRFRWKVLRKRLQRDEVNRAAEAARNARNLVALSDYFMDRHFDVIPELARLTLDSATAFINAQSTTKKLHLTRNLGSSVQLLLNSLEYTAGLGKHQSVFHLFHAVQVMLTDLFGCTSVHIYRVVDSTRVAASVESGGKAFEVGTDLHVPIQALPVAFRLFAAAPTEAGKRFAAADGTSADVAACSIDNVADMRVVSWMEPLLHRGELESVEALAELGCPEVVVSAGQGLADLNWAVEDLRRAAHTVRPAEPKDACHVTAIRLGHAPRAAAAAGGAGGATGGGDASAEGAAGAAAGGGGGEGDGEAQISSGSAIGSLASTMEAIIVMSRTEGPLTPDELFVAARLGAHVHRALRDVEARMALKESRESKERLVKGVPWMAKGRSAVEAYARSLIDCDDAVLYLVKEQRSGRPELVAASRDVRASEREGIYEHMEHLALTNGVLNLKQGNAGALEKNVELLPDNLRGFTKSMLCVPICTPAESNGVLGEGLSAVMQWRNAAKGAFLAEDVRLAREWALVAAPSLQLHGTQAHRMGLEDRVVLLTAKRDALLSSAKLLGKTRNVEALFSSIMSHAKSLMEVERSTMFLVDKRRQVLYTMVADGLGANEITIPWDKGVRAHARTRIGALRVHRHTARQAHCATDVLRDRRTPPSPLQPPSSRLLPNRAFRSPHARRMALALLLPVPPSLGSWRARAT